MSFIKLISIKMFFQLQVEMCVLDVSSCDTTCIH